jgi:SOS response associated peptidase (SRAP)
LTKAITIQSTRYVRRYVSPEEAAIEREYQIDRTNSRLRLDAEIDRAFLQSFNVAPTHNVPVVRVIRGQHGVREAALMRWGLIPFFARGEQPKYSTINATIEKLDTSFVIDGEIGSSMRTASRNFEAMRGRTARKRGEFV